MSNAASRSVPSLPFEPPDPQFRLVVGLYVAMLVVPLVLIGAVMAGVSDAATLYGVFLVAGVAVTGGVTWAVGAVDGSAVRLGNSPGRWVLFLPGIALVVGSFALLPSVGGVAMLGFFLGLFAALAGVLLAVMARSRYVKTLLDAVEVDGEWTAGWPAAAKRRVEWLAAGLIIAGLASFVGGLVVDSPLWYLGQFLVAIGAAITGYAQSQDYAATPAGLAVERGGFRRFYDWDHFDGYTRTADALVCHRPRRVDCRFALDDLDDPDAVERALGRYLARTEVASV